MIGNMICSFIGTIAFSVLFNVPKQFYFYCGLTGMSGWMCYYLLESMMSPAIATLFGTMVVVLFSRILAVWRKCPITVFLISGIFPLVPGASVYYTAYCFVTNNLVLAAQKGIDSLKIAFAIVFGIVFIVSMPKNWFTIRYWKERRDKKVVI